MTTWWLLLVGVSSFLISRLGTGENCSKKENLTEILLWDETENWEPFLTVWQKQVFHCKLQFEVGNVRSYCEPLPTPIHLTFHSFCNEFHKNSVQWIRNWKCEQWMNIEWTRTSAIDQVKYMACTHVHYNSHLDF
jgi:hypothetical protein